MEDVNRSVAVRTNERLGSLELNHCCSRHLPYSKCCLNEYYVPKQRDRERVTSSHDLHAGRMGRVGFVVLLKGGQKRQRERIIYALALPATFAFIKIVQNVFANVFNLKFRRAHEQCNTTVAVNMTNHI